MIYNSVVVGIQIHTGGTFSLAELLTDSVISPLVAKAVGMAVSSQSVADFEHHAQAEHNRLLGEIVDEARGRFATHLELHGAWREAFESIQSDVEQLRGESHALARAFEKGTGLSAAKKGGGHHAAFP